MKLPGYVVHVTSPRGDEYPVWEYGTTRRATAAGLAMIYEYWVGRPARVVTT